MHVLLNLLQVLGFGIEAVPTGQVLPERSKFKGDWLDVEHKPMVMLHFCH